MSNIIQNNVRRLLLASALGASLVGWKRDASGAQPKSIQEKMKEMVSVKDFGAKGDGVADDAPSIQYAVDYAESVGGCVVSFPAGSYMIGETIVVGNGVTLRGENRSQVFIKANADMVSDATASGTNFISNKNYNISQSGKPLYQSAESITIEGISFSYKETLPTAEEKINCIGMNNARKIIVRDCAMYRICQHAVDIAGCEDVLIENVVSVDGYWSAFQVDTAGGIYGSSGGGYASKNVTIRDCKVYRNIGERGGVQIHKNGGNYITIENCFFEDCKAAITTDDYFNDANTAIGWSVGQSTCLKIVNCQIRANTVSGSKGISILKAYANASITDCYVYVNGKPLEIVGGLVAAENYWIDSITVKGCYLRGSSIDMIGADRSAFNGNVFYLEGGELIFSARRSGFANNVIVGYGVKVESTNKINAVESKSTIYAPDACNFTDNKFISIGVGSGVSFYVSNNSFAELIFRDNIYFSNGTAFDLSGASVTSGIRIEDGFRQGVRPVTTAGRLNNGVLVGQMTYDSTLKKPIWWDGGNWKDASGTVV